MGDAKRDQNMVPTLIGVSSVDGVTPVLAWIDPVTHRVLVQLNVSTGTAAPNTTPSVVGSIFIDTNNKKAYIAMGTTNSSDWVILN